MNISVVIPVYNSEASLRPLVDSLVPVLESHAEEFELVLVNDGSRDNSGEIAAGLSKEHGWIRVIQLRRNYGQHNALLCGIRAAIHEVIVTMDDDLQHPPEEIPKLLRKLGEGADVVYGAPERKAHGGVRNLATALTRLALKSAMRVDVARDVSAFRAFRSDIRQAFENFQGPFVSIDVLLTWGTTRFAVVPVRHDPRETGRSNYTFRQLATQAMNLLTGFSTVPLQVASVIGFFFMLFGLAVLIYVVATFFILGPVVQGFAFLSCLVAIFGGAQLFTLGIVGEYLARIHFRTMERPAYVVREGDEESLG